MSEADASSARADQDPPNDGVLDVGYLWQVLRRRWRVLGVTVFVALAVACVFNVAATPIYTAQAILLLEPKPLDVVDIQDVLTRALGSSEAGYDNTQLDILRSRSLAARVIRELRLDEEPLLEDEDAPWIRGEVVDPRLVKRYLESWLEVVPLPESRLVTVGFSTPDPELSARVANAHAQAYIGYGLALRTQASLRAVDFLQGTLEELSERAARSTAALQRFREERGMTSSDQGEALAAARLGDLHRRLVDVEAVRIETETQLQLLAERGYDALPAVRDSELISNLRERLAQLESEYVFATANLKPTAPQPMDLAAQVEDARRRLDAERRRIAGSVRSQNIAAEREAEGLRAALAEEQEAAVDQKATAAEYAALEQEALTNQRLLQTVQDRMKEMSLLSEVRASSVFVIDEANAPLHPSRPWKALNLAGGLLGGLLVGLWLAFGMEMLDNRFRTSWDAERYLGLASLGPVPDLARLAREGASALIGPGSRPLPAAAPATPDRLPWLRSGAAGARMLAAGGAPPELLAFAAGEAYRAIRTSLLLSLPGEDPRTILFTSATAQEGKTTTAVNMALVYAQLDARVLLVDADLRQRRSSTLLGLGAATGLSEALAGRDAAQPRRSARAPLDVLPAGAPPPNPAELLGSPAMGDLLAALRERYDYVIVDAPPLEPVSDALVISTFVDGVVLVVDSRRVARQLVRDARNRLRRARAHLLGFVLNRVEASRPAYAYYARDEAGWGGGT